MSEVLCDLHLHSRHSDGRLSPSRLARTLARAGVRLAALTDHDTMGGFLSFFAAATALGIRVIPGIELTTRLDVGIVSEEVHILGYGLRWSDRLQTGLAEIREQRNAHQKRMLRMLREVGYDFDYERLKRHAGSDPIIVTDHLWDWLRRHPLRALGMLVSGRLRKWVDHFLHDVVGPGGSAYLLPPLSFADGIAWIHRYEGLAVLAHPGKIESAGVREAALSGEIDGIEVFYKEQESMAENLLALAGERNLVVTGGSDWHGWFSGAYGGWKLPLEHANELLVRLEQPPLPE